MKPFVVLFSHHYVNNVVIQRYWNLHRLNNQLFDIIPIGLSGCELLPNSVVVDRKIWPTNNQLDIENIDWSSGDLCIYQGFKEYPNYEKYFLLEYDTAFSIPISDFFPSIFSQDYGGWHETKNLENWVWYRQYCSHNICPIPIENCGSIVPTTCVFWDNYLLRQIVNQLIRYPYFYENMFSELRIGTLTKQFTELKLSRVDIKDYITHCSDELIIDKDIYFYHPCKKLLPDEY